MSQSTESMLHTWDRSVLTLAMDEADPQDPFTVSYQVEGIEMCPRYPKLVEVVLAPWSRTRDAYLSPLNLLASRTGQSAAVELDPRVMVGCEVGLSKDKRIYLRDLRFDGEQGEVLASFPKPALLSFLCGLPRTLTIPEEYEGAADQAVEDGYLKWMTGRRGQEARITRRGHAAAMSLRTALEYEVGSNAKPAPSIASVFQQAFQASTSPEKTGTTERRLKMPQELAGWYDEQAALRGNDATSLMREALFQYARSGGFPTKTSVEAYNNALITGLLSRMGSVPGAFGR